MRKLTIILLVAIFAMNQAALINFVNLRKPEEFTMNSNTPKTSNNGEEGQFFRKVAINRMDEYEKLLKKIRLYGSW